MIQGRGPRGGRGRPRLPVLGRTSEKRRPAFSVASTPLFPPLHGPQLLGPANAVERRTRHHDLPIRHEFVFLLISGSAACERHLTHRSSLQYDRQKLTNSYQNPCLRRFRCCPALSPEAVCANPYGIV